MKLAILKERTNSETRVAASPDSVKKLNALNVAVRLERGAGKGAHFADRAFAEAGATIVDSAEAALDGADIILKVQAPTDEELIYFGSGSILVGMLDPYKNRDRIVAYAKARVDAFSMELLPRITRAQTMDVLSSQSNLAGYKAVINAASEFGRAMPMMMTAAGTVAPARVLVMGAGVAGMQAIATARRLGAIVTATDVRPAAKEQVQSLGAKFLSVESEETRGSETAGGYAREMSEDYRQRQTELIAETVKSQDIIVLTALVPGRPAPTLLSEEMVASMKPGSVIVDLAVEQGGNCTLSQPGSRVVVHDVTIVGFLNTPGRLATDASSLYARNLLSFVTPLITGTDHKLNIDWEDEIITATALTRGGNVIHPSFLDGASD